jgi:hypothetical protein
MPLSPLVSGTAHLREHGPVAFKRLLEQRCKILLGADEPAERRASFVASFAGITEFSASPSPHVGRCFISPSLSAVS